MGLEIKKTEFGKNAEYQSNGSKNEERKFERYLLVAEKERLIKNMANPTQQDKQAVMPTDTIGKAFTRCCKNNN